MHFKKQVLHISLKIKILIPYFKIGISKSPGMHAGLSSAVEHSEHCLRFHCLNDRRHRILASINDKKG